MLRDDREPEEGKEGDVIGGMADSATEEEAAAYGGGEVCSVKRVPLLIPLIVLIFIIIRLMVV
jgi:hypothetical protein